MICGKIKTQRNKQTFKTTIIYNRQRRNKQRQYVYLLANPNPNMPNVNYICLLFIFLTAHLIIANLHAKILRIICKNIFVFKYVIVCYVRWYNKLANITWDN